MSLQKTSSKLVWISCVLCIAFWAIHSLFISQRKGSERKTERSEREAQGGGARDESEAYNNGTTEWKFKTVHSPLLS